MQKAKIPSAVLTTVEMSEWKHKILKIVAALLFIKKANYVMVISEIDTQWTDQIGTTITSTLLEQSPSEEIALGVNTALLSSKTTRLFRLVITELPLATSVLVEQQESVRETWIQVQSTGKVTTTYVGRHTQKQTRFSVAHGKRWSGQLSTSQEHRALVAQS